MDTGEKSSLQKGIERRQQELHTVAEFIARKAARLTKTANLVKIATITLGAVTAAKGTVDTIIGTADHWSLAIFSVIGVAIAVCAGVEAAFKFDKRGAELTVLASSCQADARKVDTAWRTEIGSKHGTDQSDAERRLIATADTMLAKAQEAAAKIGANYTAEVYELAGDDYRAQVSA